ncbi:MAG: putative ATP-dependent DNA ligase [Natrialbaceae archaeon]|jgi:putative ATP-dependent DNA ligase
MDSRHEYHRALGLSKTTFDRIQDEFVNRYYEGTEYRSLPDYRKHLEKGTVLIAGMVVRGFPKIPRTLVIEEGIPRYFAGEFAVEEKMNGYNVRVTQIGNEVYAFTRGGIICPYTTWKVEADLDLEPFFEEYPGTMVCGEMAGPENPYTPHDYEDIDSLAFRAFDVRDRETGESIRVSDRRSILEEFDIPQVPFFGVFSPREAVEELPGIIDELDDAGREGIVMKTPHVTQQLKYTTSSANRGSLAFAFSLPFDYGQDFMFRRIIREAFQSAEWDESPQQARERAHALGEAILLSMTDTIEDVGNGATIGERHAVRGDGDAIAALLEHLRDQGLQLEIEADEAVDAGRFVRFVKRTQATKDKTEAYLDGTIVQE